MTVRNGVGAAIAATHQLARLFKRCEHSLLDTESHDDSWQEWGQDGRRCLRLGLIVASFLDEARAGKAPRYPKTTRVAFEHAARPELDVIAKRLALQLEGRYFADRFFPGPFALMLWYAEQEGALSVQALDDEDLSLYLEHLQQRGAAVRERYVDACLFAAGSALAFEAAQGSGAPFEWARMLNQAPELAAVAHLSLMLVGPANGLGGDVRGLELVTDIPPQLAV